MPDNHEAVAALPSGSAAVKDLLRGLIVGRLIYFLGAAEDAQDFVAVDPSTGDVPPALAQNEKIFWYDAADTTTAHDGTCLEKAAPTQIHACVHAMRVEQVGT